MSSISDANFKTFGREIALYPGQRVIRIGDKILPIGIGNNAMPEKPTSFYKCSAVYGPREVETVVISGCPTEAVNGNYLPTEFTTSDWEGNPQPVYSNGTYYYYYEPNNWMTWGVGTDYNGNLLYTGSIGGSWSNTDNWETVDGMSAAKGTATVDTDIPKTWDGYKAVLADGVYSFEDTLTTGLTYSDNKPVKFGIYNQDATIKADWLMRDYPMSGLDFFAPLQKTLDFAEETGQSLVNTKAELAEIGGKKCARFDASRRSNIYCDTAGFVGSGINSWTVFVNFYIDTATTSEGFLLYLGGANDHMEIQARYYTTDNQTYVRFETGAYGNEQIAIPIERGAWNSFTFIHDQKGGKISAYHGKTHIETKTGTLHGIAPATVVIGRNSGSYGTGYVNNVMVYSRGLTKSEIDEIVDKFGIVHAPVIAPTTPVTLTAYLENEASLQLKATVKHATGASLSFSSSDLPDGLSVSASGLITGTPTAIGTGSSTVTVSYPGADSVQITVNWEVKAASEKPTIPTDGLVFYAPLSAARDTAETGQAFTVSGEVAYETVDGVPCLALSGSSIRTSAEGLPSNDATLSCWVRQKTESPFSQVFGYGVDSPYRVCVLVGDGYTMGVGLVGIERGSGQIYSESVVADGKWHNLVVTIGSDGVNKLWLDGTEVYSFEQLFELNASGNLAIGSWVNGGYESDMYVASCRVYNRVLTSDEISELANEFSIGE